MNINSSEAKQAILNKIRSGLQHAVPRPFPEVSSDTQGIYTLSALSPEEQFAEAFISLGGKFVFCNDEAELLPILLQVCDDQDWQQVLCADERLLNLFHNGGLSFIQKADKKMSGADACITTCELLSARTGSAFFSSAQSMGRVAPVYFPVHIIIAYTKQIVRDIDEALYVLTNKEMLPSMINLNTGPSRTADIEKTLVVGVHGPREVWCFLIGK